MTDTYYNTAELVAIMSARFLEDGKIVFGGAGMPLISCILAQKTHAPRLTILFEGGVIGPHVQAGKLPPSTNEQRAARRANMLCRSRISCFCSREGTWIMAFSAARRSTNTET